MSSDNYHKETLKFNFRGCSYEGSFYYIDDSYPVEKREPEDFSSFDNTTGYMFKDNSTTFGFINFERKIDYSDDITHFFEEGNMEFQISRLKKFGDFSITDEKLRKRILIPEKQLSIPEFFDLKTPRNLKPFKRMLNELIVSSDKSFNLSEAVKLWKEFKKMKMDKYMAIFSYIERDVISRCPYISIETIKENPLFRFNWELLTVNPAIPIRDILSNPDLPWVYSVMSERRDVSEEIMNSKGIYHKNSNLPKKYNYSEIEILMSPIDPISNQPEKFCDTDDCSVDKVISVLEVTLPEYFNNIPPNLYDELRDEIRKNIDSNGNVFNIYSFDLPRTRTDDDRKHFSFDVHPNEDDPLGLRVVIDEIENYGDYSSEASKIYESKVGVDIDLCGAIKNRDEFVEFIKTANCIPGLENNIFFEFDDLVNYRNAFDCLGVDLDGTSVMLRSGKVTVDFFINSNLVWFLNDLVGGLPLDFVFENLLFYPNRIKFKNIKENVILGFDENKTRDDFLKQDKLAMEVFCNRKDFDPEYYVQFREINWILPMNNEFVESVFELSVRSEEEDINKLQNMSWDDIKTKDGIRIFCKALDLEVDKNPKIKDEEIHYLLGMCFPSKIPPQFLTEDVIRKVPRVGWDLNISIDLVDLFDYFENNDVSLFQIYIYLISTGNIEESTSNLFSKTIYLLVEKSKTGVPDEDLILYENIIEFLPFLTPILKLMESPYNNLKEKLKKLSYCFSVEVMALSKYSNICSIIEALNKA